MTTSTASCIRVRRRASPSATSSSQVWNPSRTSYVKELRLLIGNTTNRETLEQIAEGYRRLDLVSEAVEAQQYPKRAEQRRMIEEGRVHVRVYTKGRLHAKAYIPQPLNLTAYGGRM